MRERDAAWRTARQRVQESDPAATRLMLGFPPPPALRVDTRNWMDFPQARWAVRHGRTVLPSLDVRRGARPEATLQEAPMALDSVPFIDHDGHPNTLGGYLATSFVDGFIVLHRGRVVFESYPGSMRQDEQHSLASITKSITALLVHLAIDQGLMDLACPLRQYVDELAGTPPGEATLQQNLDMAVAMRFPPDQPFNTGYWAAAGLLPQAAGRPATIYDFIRQVGEPLPGTGQVMQYQSSSPEAVTWALQRVTGQPWHLLLQDQVWQHLGASHDAYTVVDRAGMPLAAGGLSTTLRDLARLGEMLRLGGHFNGRQIVPERVVHRMLEPHENHIAFAAGNFSEKAAASGVRYSYHNYWYRVDGVERGTQRHGTAWQAHGVLSQYLHIAPADELVIAQLASTPLQGPIALPSFNRAALAITHELCAG